MLQNPLHGAAVSHNYCPSDVKGQFFILAFETEIMFQPKHKTRAFWERNGGECGRTLEIKKLMTSNVWILNGM